MTIIHHLCQYSIGILHRHLSSSSLYSILAHLCFHHWHHPSQHISSIHHRAQHPRVITITGQCHPPSSHHYNHPSPPIVSIRHQPPPSSAIIIKHNTSYIKHCTSYHIQHTSCNIHSTWLILHSAPYIIHITAYIVAHHHRTATAIHHDPPSIVILIPRHFPYSAPSIVHYHQPSPSIVIRHTHPLSNMHHRSFIVHHTTYNIHHTAYIILHHTSWCTSIGHRPCCRTSSIIHLHTHSHPTLYVAHRASSSFTYIIHRQHWSSIPSIHQSRASTHHHHYYHQRHHPSSPPTIIIIRITHHHNHGYNHHHQNHDLSF